jgi:hypothetical protein
LLPVSYLSNRKTLFQISIWPFWPCGQIGQIPPENWGRAEITDYNNSIRAPISPLKSS